jgi:glutaconate CoA-transferase subunit B
MDFEECSKRMRLLSLNPGVTVEDVRKNTGFALVTPGKAARNPPPTPEELGVLRKEVDPHRLYI